MKIENDKNVYILGAGFSAIRGMPCIPNFMLRLRDAHPWLVNQKREREAAAVERVIEYRLQSAAAAYRIPIDLENIEELFSLADAGKDVLSRDIRVAIAATLDFATETQLEPTTAFTWTEEAQPPALPANWKRRNQKPLQCTAPTYEFFIQSLLGGWHGSHAKAAFITFNYDCLVERALMGLNVPFRYGFGVDGNGADGTASGTAKSRDSSVWVLKLHGSVNWMRPKVGSRILKVASSYTEVRSAEGVPELVPPTWRKLFARELVEIWKIALEELKSATRIVILGFSMPETDLHFKYLLAAGLRENVSLREIVFVDKNPGPLEARARKLFGPDMERQPGVRVIGTGIGQFIGAGQINDGVFSIGRGIPIAVQGVQHSRW